MTVLIASTIGASRMYADRDMFRRTRELFLRSLEQQSDSDFHVFLVGHEIFVEYEYSWLHQYSVSGDGEHFSTVLLKDYPENPNDQIYWDSPVAYGDGLTDMSRKTRHSLYEAARWAWRNSLYGFWLLRMDSDDCLAQDHVAFLNSLNPEKIKAVYNRNCHMYDIRTGQIAEHRYPYSTTCNALYYTIDREGKAIPSIYWHWNDHTKFAAQVRERQLPFLERDWTLCITTNSSNHLSGRPEIEKEQYNTLLIDAAAVRRRYGLSD